MSGATRTARSVVGSSGLELSIRDFPGIDPSGATNCGAAISSAIATASALGIAKGCIARIGGWDAFGAGVYKIGGVLDNIFAASNVLLDWGEARIVAGADLVTADPTSRGGILRALETVTPAVGVGTADTTAGSRKLVNVSNPDSYYREMVVTGAGIPANTKVTAISQRAGVFEVGLDTAATATAAGVPMTRAATRYGSYRDFRISGGIIDPNGMRVGPIVRLLFMDRMHIEGTRILHHLPEAYMNWATALGGRGCLVEDVEILDGLREFADGLHVTHGQDWRIKNCHVESGDDMVALGHELGDVFDLEPDPIRRVVVEGITGRAMYATALKIYVQAGATGRDHEITDVEFSNVAAEAGLTNFDGYGDVGAIRFRDYNAGAAGTSQIKRIGVSDSTLKAGSALHTGQAGLNPAKIVHLASVDDVTLTDVRLRGDQDSAAAIGLDVLRIESSRDVTIRKTSAALLTRGFAWVTDSDRVTLEDNLIQCGAASGVPVRLNAVTGARVIDNTFRDLRTGQPAIQITEGVGTTVTIRRNRAHGAAGDAYLLMMTAAAVAAIDLGDDNDLRNCAGTFEPSISSAAEFYSLTKQLPGLLAPPRHPDGVRSLLAQRAHFNRFEVKRATRATKVGFAVTVAAGSDDACYVGIYDASGARIAVSASTTGKLNATGPQTVSLTAAVTLQPGTYYAAFVCPTIGGTAATLAGILYGDVRGAQLLGTTFPNVLQAQMTGQATLPGAMVPLDPANTNTAVALVVTET